LEPYREKKIDCFEISNFQGIVKIYDYIDYFCGRGWGILLQVKVFFFLIVSVVLFCFAFFF